VDVSVFKSVKSEWKKIVREYYITSLANIDKTVFPVLLKKLWENNFTRTIAVSGFENTGIFPVNRSKITESKLAIGQAFALNNGENSTKLLGNYKVINKCDCLSIIFN
jgi:hypothetical protein